MKPVPVAPRAVKAPRSSAAPSPGRSALAKVFGEMASRQAADARLELLQLAGSPVGSAARRIARIAQADDPEDQFLGELAQVIAEKMER